MKNSEGSSGSRREIWPRVRSPSPSASRIRPASMIFCFASSRVMMLPDLALGNIELRHLNLDSVLACRFLIKLRDSRRLVLVLDLRAAFLDAGRDAAEQRFALAFGERVARAAVCGGQITRRHRSSIEMLVEHLVGRRE